MSIREGSRDKAVGEQTELISAIQSDVTTDRLTVAQAQRGLSNLNTLSLERFNLPGLINDVICLF
jgi:hypothetical protein